MRRMIASCVALALASAVPALAVTPFVNETAHNPPNPIAQTTSLALDSRGNPHISYQEGGAAGNLLYARKVAGTWIFETADGAANAVGANSSIALDAQGNPHVSYRDATATDLKYANRIGGVWTVEFVEISASNLGDYISLALDSQGNPHIAYRDGTALDVRYARKSGGAWILEIADGAATSVGDYVSLALDGQGNPHVTYRNSTFDIKYARRTGASWAVETVDSSATAVFAYTSLDLDPQGNPHLAYRDASGTNLVYARKSGGAWSTEIADTLANVGNVPSLDLDAQGEPHIAHLDVTNGDLKYATKSGGSWILEFADASPANAGDGCALALDQHGNPHVSYRETTNSDLKYAHAAVRVLLPQGAITWPVGSLQTVTWSGVGPVDVLLSVDGGRRFDTLFSSISQNAIALRVPHAKTRAAIVRIERASPFSSAESDSFFTIDATVSLLKFDARVISEPESGSLSGERGGDVGSVRLAWETDPAPPAIAGFRVERAVIDGLGEGTPAPASADYRPLHMGLLERFKYDDEEPAPIARYRLVAVNGFGEEQLLGETTIAPSLGPSSDLVVSPNPAPGGRARVLFRVPAGFAQTSLAVFDASGRRVRTLASGALTAGATPSSGMARMTTAMPSRRVSTS